MNLEEKLVQSVIKTIESLYGQTVEAKTVQLQTTKKEFEGDLTLVVFPFLKISKKTPEVTANEIGDYLVKNESIVEKFNVIPRDVCRARPGVSRRPPSAGPVP